VNTVIEFEREAYVQGARFVDPILFTETVSNVPAGQVAILYGWSAFNATVSSGSASGLAGVCQALAFLAEARGSVAVAGGGDELSRPLLSALRQRGTVTDRAGSLPLSADRSGPVGGEGACFLTIESETHADRRGAEAVARVLATAARFAPGAPSSTGDARESMADLIRTVTASAGIPPESVDLVVLSASARLPATRKKALPSSPCSGTDRPLRLSWPRSRSWARRGAHPGRSRWLWPSRPCAVRASPPHPTVSFRRRKP